MLRTLKALLLVSVAMVLSLTLAFPASAADPVVPDPRFKYGLKYYYQEMFDPKNLKGFTEVNVSGNLNPSKTGGSYYLNQVKKNIDLNPANKPLAGKIIQPGKTVVRAPSTYVSAPKFVAGGTPGFSKLLGGLGIGIGGTSVAPSNSAAVALGQGVTAGCVDGSVACTPDEIRKKFAIDSCGATATCDSIGAKAQGGDPFSDFFRTDALPFLKDLWAQITGQKGGTEELPDPNGHYEVAPRGCFRIMTDVSFIPGTNNVTVTPSSELVKVKPLPNNSVPANYWETDCGAAAVSKVSTMGGAQMDSTCVDKVTGKTVGTDGVTLGATWGISGPDVFDVTTLTNKVPLCKTGVNNQLVAVQFRNTNTQAYYDGSPSRYSAMKYSRWENHNPEGAALDTVEGLTVTTTADCQTSDGQILTLTQSIGKTAAFIAPECPPGSTLVRHDVKTATAGGTTATIDSGLSAPGAATKYADCLNGSGCTMDVHLDGSVCTTARAECHNWPAVAAQTPSRVVCKWGAHSMPTSDCFGLSNGYKSETGVVFDPSSGTWVAVDAYGNPIAANPEPWNATNPNPVAGTSPGTGSSPGAATGTFPGSGTSPSDGCVSPSWSWNPVDWVKNPVVCALKDAFVPKTDVTGRVAELQALTLNKPPLNWISPPVTGPGGGGCPNWVITLPGVSQNVVCDSSFTAAILGARGPLFGLVATAMVWPLMRGIWYAAIPILRVSPGGSK